MRLGVVALVLLVVCFGLHAPVLADGALLGAPQTDVVRALWGFDHQARALPGLPFWTDRIGWPTGVKFLVLPMYSSVFAAPFHLLLGAVRGYTVWVLGLWWLTAFCTAVWVREVAGSLVAGLAAALVFAVQPSLLLALTDGTPEHVAFWGVPAMLACLARARTDGAPGWGVAGGLLSGAVAFDSPYHAVFAVPMVLLLLVGMPRRQILAFGVTAAACGGLLVLAYYGLPLTGRMQNRTQNAAKLDVWWQWEARGRPKPWDYTFTPAFVPAAVLGGAFALALLRARRAAPWIGVAVLGLVLALGEAPENPHALATWLGAPGQALGDAVVSFNHVVAPALVRFPRRWLVPASFAAVTAAGIGLARLPSELWRAIVGLPAALLAVQLTLDETGYRAALPSFALPDPEFARYVRGSPGDGVALAIPRQRGARRLHERWELPVFADLDPSITSADMVFLQVALGRPMMNAQEGLFTLTPRRAPSDDVTRWLRDLDDYAVPQTTGSPIPDSATQEPERRRALAKVLVERGLRFVVVDEAVYADDGLRHVRDVFSGLTVEDRHFDDGSGVTVLVLGR